MNNHNINRTETVSFLDLAKHTPEHAWRFLEKQYAKGQQNHPFLMELFLHIPSSMMAPPQEDEPFRSSFWNRLLKNEETSLISQLFSVHPTLKNSIQDEIFNKRFNILTKSKNESFINLVLPDGPYSFDSKKWSTALLSKNPLLLEKLNYSVETTRAINFIENYFFDLQLNQLRYLNAFISNHQWPFKFLKDSLVRQKSPGVIQFFLDRIHHQLMQPDAKFSIIDLGQTLQAAIYTHNEKSFNKLLQTTSVRPFPIDQLFDLPDLKICFSNCQIESNDIKISINKLPPALRQTSLLEHLIIQNAPNFNAMSKPLLEAAHRLKISEQDLFSQERIDLWKTSILKMIQQKHPNPKDQQKIFDDYIQNMETNILFLKENSLETSQKNTKSTFKI